MGMKSWCAALLVIGLSFSAHAAGKSLVYCSETSPAQVNPVLSIDVGSTDLGRHVYDNLVESAPDLGALRPGLAESWTESKDHLTYTFTLRTGVAFQKTDYFQPTRTMNADDVVYSFERWLNPAHPYHKQGSYPSVASFALTKLIKSVRKTDDRHVVLELSSPYAPMLDLLSTKSIGAIFSKEYGEKVLKAGHPEQFDTRPIGTGPFILKSFERGSKVVFAAHEGYYRGRPPLDRLVFAIVPESSVRIQKLHSGECQVIYQPDPTSLAGLEADPAFAVMRAPGSNIGYVGFNVEKKPLNDVRVRRALFLAMNRANYIDAVYLKNAKLAQGPLPEISWGHADVLAGMNYDPERAKALLKEAGFEKGFKIKMWDLPVSRAYLPNGKKLGELIQADLAKIGVQVTLEQLDWSAHLTLSEQGKHEIVQIGWNVSSPDPDLYFTPLLTCDAIKPGGNLTRWCNPKFDLLIERARAHSDHKERKALYLQAMRMFADAMPFAPIAYGTVYQVARKNVKNYKVRSDGTVDFYGVDVD